MTQNLNISLKKFHIKTVQDQVDVAIKKRDKEYLLKMNLTILY
jgi:hypothetical protein